MKGYVENIGMAPVYMFKGVIGKGERISFNVLEKRFGNKANTNSSVEFSKWLSKNTFSNGSKWKVVVEDKPEKIKKEAPKEIKKEPKPVSKVTSTNKEIITRSVTGVSKEMTVDDVVNIKVSELDKLERIKDEKLLRSALKKAERMDKKATLCNKIRDRLLAFDMR